MPVFKNTKELNKRIREMMEVDYDKSPLVCRIPTLSELIEACGEGFSELVRSNNYITKPMWLAYPSEEAFNKSDNDCVLDCCGYEIGSTPEEAVTNLWLAINKK